MPSAVGLVTHPAPVLHQPTEPVDAFDDELRDQMQALLNAHLIAGGLGLAAPQIGISRRFFVWATDMGPAHIVNPTIVDRDGATTDIEACLSIPGLNIPVRRPTHIAVVGHDIEGHRYAMKAQGQYARVLAHELDHLDGKLIIDY